MGWFPFIAKSQDPTFWVSSGIVQFWDGTLVSGNFILLVWPLDKFFYGFCIWCWDKLGFNREQADGLLTSEPEGNKGHPNPSSGHWVVHLWPFGTGLGPQGPLCTVPLSMPAGFLPPHFCFLVLFIVVVLACEVFPTMGQTSSKPKTPWDLVLSHFQDFRDAATVSAAHVKLGQLRVLCSLEWPAF